MYLYKRDNIVKRTEVAYWRKANQIHNWFVKGKRPKRRGQMQALPLLREDLGKLLAVCQEVKQASKLVQGKVYNGTTWEKGKEPVVDMIDGRLSKIQK